MEGDDVTIFHRGQTNPELFAGQVARISGDRDGGLGALAGGAVGRRGRHLRATSRVSWPRRLRALADRCGHYTFVSTESVYGDVGEPGLDESAPVAALDDRATEVVDGDTYGGLKALCEEAARGGDAGAGCSTCGRGSSSVLWDPFGPLHLLAAGGSPQAATCSCPAARSILGSSSSTGATSPAWMLSAAHRGLTGVMNACGPAAADRHGGASFECVRARVRLGCAGPCGTDEAAR